MDPLKRQLILTTFLIALVLLFQAVAEAAPSHPSPEKCAPLETLAAEEVRLEDADAKDFAESEACRLQTPRGPDCARTLKAVQSRFVEHSKRLKQILEQEHVVCDKRPDRWT